MQLPDHAPFTPEEKQQLSSILSPLSPQKACWLSGFLAGFAGLATEVAAFAPTGKTLPVHVLFGSESGNAEALASEAQKILSARGLAPVVKDLAETTVSDLGKMKHVLVITSTWGDGDPPDAVVPFHESLMGDDAPALKNLRFSICALGDTSYEKFCQTGKDFDHRFEQLGGTRLVDRKDCDVDFDAPFVEWIEAVAGVLAEEAGNDASASASPVALVAPAGGYGKKTPFPSTLRERILLNGRGSAKETLHLEFSLEGSGLTYQPGDSLALVPVNARDVVEAVIQSSGLDGDQPVPLKNGEAKPLSESLATDLDITGLTKSVMQKYNEVAESKKLAKLLEDKQAVSDYTWGRQVVDLLEEFPCKGLTPEQFIGCLRKLPPRLYSIASSLKAHPDEVHLTIAVVRYSSHGKDRKGVASTFSADHLKIGEHAPVFIAPNKHFKLPENSDQPIIMVGPGTGIAPFRAFVEERKALGAKGKNWLFFGDQHYSYDFLYQLEWQEYLKDGLLTRLDLAFSRDQNDKIYVQHRMIERGKDLWAWLQDGATFYVCGDANRMARDVHDALIAIAEKHGGMARETAEEHIATLQKEKRYLRDVY